MESVLSNCSVLIVSAHLKCPRGQAFLPWMLHGRQFKGASVSTIKDRFDKGVKPNAGIVEQNIAVTFAFTADAK